MQHGLLKGALLLLGVSHHHDGEDIVATCGWQAMAHALGYSVRGNNLHQNVDLKSLVMQRIVELRNCNTVLRNESQRLAELKKQRATVRIAAETEARQQGLGIAETDQVGQKAADSVEDPGSEDAALYATSLRIHDDHVVDGILPLSVKHLRYDGNMLHRSGLVAEWGALRNQLRARCRHVPTPCSQLHSKVEISVLFQTLLEKGSISVQMGKRICSKCGRIHPSFSAITVFSTMLASRKLAKPAVDVPT